MYDIVIFTERLTLRGCYTFETVFACLCTSTPSQFPCHIAPKETYCTLVNCEIFIAWTVEHSTYLLRLHYYHEEVSPSS
ncbi:Transcription factor kkR [Frankliniella fusca]|uniref:Transcription factor kkR n=1 Tax=Frankliniella fusca TaxID=407009 RepID=A0AAE1GVU7_9NEOP|nr:Transcription factor kkR [Frankliniella fusca]